MVTQIEWQEIKNLLDQGLTIAEVSRRSGRCRATIKNLTDRGSLEKISENFNISELIKPFEKYIKSRIKQRVTNRHKMFLEIKDQNYQGSYPTLNNYIKALLRISNSRAYKPSSHFETGIGEQAQVDWGSFGKIEINGRQERLYAFVYVLGYSRAMYIEFTIKQNLKTLEMAHIHAFEKLGIPRTIVYDNMKTVVLEREKRPGNILIPRYNPAFYDFSRYYDFQIFACPPYWPRAKGKVESGVKYVRNNFMQGMKFNKRYDSLEDLNKKARVWLDTVANVREHRSTGKKPYDMWLEEKEYLRFPQTLPQYPVSTLVVRYSTKDGLIHYKSNFYSVPREYMRKKLYIRETNCSGLVGLEIFHQSNLITSHKLSNDRGKWIVDEKHIIASSSKVATFANSRKLISRKVISFKNRLPYVIYTRGLDYYGKLISGAKNVQKES